MITNELRVQINFFEEFTILPPNGEMLFDGDSGNWLTF